MNNLKCNKCKKEFEKLTFESTGSDGFHYKGKGVCKNCLDEIRADYELDKYEENN